MGGARPLTAPQHGSRAPPDDPPDHRLGLAHEALDMAVHFRRSPRSQEWNECDVRLLHQIPPLSRQIPLCQRERMRGSNGRLTVMGAGRAPAGNMAKVLSANIPTVWASGPDEALDAKRPCPAAVPPEVLAAAERIAARAASAAQPA